MVGAASKGALQQLGRLIPLGALAHPVTGWLLCGVAVW